MRARVAAALLCLVAFVLAVPEQPKVKGVRLLVPPGCQGLVRHPAVKSFVFSDFPKFPMVKDEFPDGMGGDPRLAVQYEGQEEEELVRLGKAEFPTAEAIVELVEKYIAPVEEFVMLVSFQAEMRDLVHNTKNLINGKAMKDIPVSEALLDAEATRKQDLQQVINVYGPVLNEIHQCQEERDFRRRKYCAVKIMDLHRRGAEDTAALLRSIEEARVAAYEGVQQDHKPTKAHIRDEL